MRAGYVLISELLSKGESFYEKLNGFGRRLIRGLEDSIERIRAQCHVTGLGSMVGIHFTEEVPRDPLTSERTKNLKACELLFKHMIERNTFFLTPTKPHLFLSAAHTLEEVDKFVSAFEDFLARNIELVTRKRGS